MSSPSRRIASIRNGSTARRVASQVPGRQSSYPVTLMFESLRKLRRQRLPGRGVATAFVARDDSALRVHDEYVGLVVRAEPSGESAVRIGDRRPGPPVPLDELPTLVRRIRDIESEKRELRVISLELGVGDRLALTRASPRRPDVHEYVPTPESGKGGLGAVEGGSGDRRRLRTRGTLGRDGVRVRRGGDADSSPEPSPHPRRRARTRREGTTDAACDPG